MDNTGYYTSIAELLVEMANAGSAEKAKIVLSNKVNISGTTFEFDYAGDDPQVGDFLTQGSYHATISQVSGGKIQASDATNITTGGARWVRTDFLESELAKFIEDAMDFIDRHTRQWFNSRTFDDSNPVLLEGNNSRTLFLPVPILEITSLKKTPESEELPSDAYRVFDGRSFPDDRRNPMIKLIRDDDDVLFVTHGMFMRGQRTRITGRFGFLEEDGSTPSMVQKATLKMATKNAIQTIGEQAAESVSSGDKGPIKREKTDFHEIEYYDANAGSGQDSGTGLSGDDFIDDVIASYKGPIIVSGTFPDIGREAPHLTSVYGSHGGRSGRGE